MIPADRRPSRVCRDATTREDHRGCSGCSGCGCHGVPANPARLREVAAQARAERRTRGQCAPTCGHSSHRPLTGW